MAHQPASDSPGPAGPQAPFDREGALAQVGGDPSFLWDVVQTFRTEGPQLLARIREAASAGDGDRLRRAAHTLRGAASVLAAGAVTRLAGQLEDVGRSGRMTDAAAVLAVLEERFGELLTALAVLGPPQPG
jgi:HPt (histidine-containing phosphotransfer) domain-containing protein